ncbi:MAG: hypothetical protein U0984_11500 [Prosthecobacter sp.]|nr:hypothetical protein [Prosthecobacter sp.]
MNAIRSILAVYPQLQVIAEEGGNAMFAPIPGVTQEGYASTLLESRVLTLDVPQVAVYPGKEAWEVPFTGILRLKRVWDDSDLLQVIEETFGTKGTFLVVGKREDGQFQIDGVWVSAMRATALG